MKRWILVTAFVGLCGLLAGCGPSNKAPDWVSRGSGVFPGDKGQALYAVGTAGFEQNPTLQSRLAKNDARVELASQMQVYVASLMKDFMQAHKDYADPNNSSSIQFTQSVSKSITEATLTGSTQIEAWTDPATKTYYVLLTMPLRDALKQSQTPMMAAARAQAAEVFKEKADAALKELDAEIQKRQTGAPAPAPAKAPAPAPAPAK